MCVTSSVWYRISDEGFILRYAIDRKNLKLSGYYLISHIMRHCYGISIFIRRHAISIRYLDILLPNPTRTHGVVTAFVYSSIRMHSSFSRSTRASASWQWPSQELMVQLSDRYKKREDVDCVLGLRLITFIRAKKVDTNPLCWYAYVPAGDQTQTR